MDRAITVVTILVILCLSFTIITYLFFRPYEIEGSSMSPTIENGETVLITSSGGVGERGDIVVIDILYDDNFSLSSSEQYIIKRVVGVGGDRIGFVYNQDKSEYYLYLNKGNGWEKTQENFSMKRVSDLFSNIENCLDESELDSKSVLIESGKVFVLGDNRDVSADSRKFGQFSLKSIKGKYLYTLPKDGILEFMFSLVFTKENSIN